ncbi:hypothetical protein B0H19DRAFT_1261274 [Mycena capillaripes]|nr:hypothetical protein B0H19DRAFT_1261274 [Mycena capillaripes]
MHKKKKNVRPRAGQSSSPSKGSPAIQAFNFSGLSENIILESARPSLAAAARAAAPPCGYPHNVVFSTNQQWDHSTAKNKKPATKPNGTSGLLAATKAYSPAVAWYFRPAPQSTPPVSHCTPGSVLSDSEFSTCTYAGSVSLRTVNTDAGVAERPARWGARPQTHPHPPHPPQSTLERPLRRSRCRLHPEHRPIHERAHLNWLYVSRRVELSSRRSILSPTSSNSSTSTSTSNSNLNTQTQTQTQTQAPAPAPCLPPTLASHTKGMQFALSPTSSPPPLPSHKALGLGVSIKQ